MEQWATVYASNYFHGVWVVIVGLALPVKGQTLTIYIHVLYQENVWKDTPTMNGNTGQSTTTKRNVRTMEENGRNSAIFLRKLKSTTMKQSARVQGSSTFGQFHMEVTRQSV